VRRLPGVRLNQMFGDQLQWMPDQKTLLVKLVHAQKAPPAEAPGADGPGIQESLGATGQSSTYENRDTLRNRHDEALFELLRQVAAGAGRCRQRQDHAGRQAGPVRRTRCGAGRPPCGRDRDPSAVFLRHHLRPLPEADRPLGPDRKRPAKGANPVVREIAALPLADRVPNRGVPTGPRNFTWRPTDAATLVWAEALDGGNPNVQAAERDKLMMLKAPFNAAPVEIVRTQQRYAGLAWSEQPGVALLSDYDVNRKWQRTWQLNVDDAQNSRRLVWDMSSDEKYADPGRAGAPPAGQRRPVVRVDGDTIYLSGVGSSPDGDRPFLDKFNLKTQKAERLFRSSKTSYEQFLGFAGNDTGRLLTWYQSVAETPNAFVRTLGAAQTRRRGRAGLCIDQRGADPPGRPDAASPRDQEAPGEVQARRRHRTLVHALHPAGLQGRHARADHPERLSARLCGRFEGRPDHRLASHLHAPAPVPPAAVVGLRHHRQRRLPDRRRSAQGLRHLHRAAGGQRQGRRRRSRAPGRGRSGAHRRDKLKTPLLLVHGGDDANPGTTPLQSVKLYEAIRGNGGVTRLVMLPHEPHWYAARESNEQLVYEMLRWFDKYVKNAPVGAQTASR
jgi:hypothetical protein